MAFQVSLPCVFHGGFEGNHKHTLGLQLLCKLIGGKSLAKTHLSIPKEPWRSIFVLSPNALKIVKGFVHCGLLFCTGREVLVTRACNTLALTQGNENSFHILNRAAHPFQLRVLTTLA